MKKKVLRKLRELDSKLNESAKKTLKFKKKKGDK